MSALGNASDNSSGAAAGAPMPETKTKSIRRPRPPQLRRRAFIVGAMRLILPAIAALLLAAFALWSHFGLDTCTFLLAIGSFGLASAISLAITNPHFAGMDSKKRTFIRAGDSHPRV